MQRALAPRWAALWYSLAAVLMTWPLALGLGRDIPWDLGDALLNCWILAWNSEHVLEALGGNPSVLSGLWHGNIFHPEPYALAYSELLIAQTIQGLPVYALTGNAVLVFNLLFLSTFILSAWGMYLFVRELTGDARAAFLAGLIHGFMPYRTAEGPHLQVLSSQWMPFALYGMRRYFVTGSWRALSGSVLAIVAQNLSCGYYLVVFALLLRIDGGWEVRSQRRLADWRMWGALAAAGLVVAVCTVPFMLPYLELRALTGQQRTLEEAASFGAEPSAYANADADLRLWPRALPAHPRPEGNLFPGLALLLLAAAGVVATLRHAWVDTAQQRGRAPGLPRLLTRWRMPLLVLCAATLAVSLLGWIPYLFGGPPRLDLGPLHLRFRDVERLLVPTLAAAGVLLAWSPHLRAALLAAVRTREACFVGCAVCAAYLSLGPSPQWDGWPLRGLDVYPWLFAHVPGFDGLRVPARFAMMAFLSLAVVGGTGAAMLLARSGRFAVLVFGALAIGILAESAAVPLPLNQVTKFTELEPIPARVGVVSDVPLEYQYLARLPAGAVVVEFPLGDVGWDLWAVYHSTFHWKPLVNGFSGGFPRRYDQLAGLLFNVNADPDRAWEALREAGPTHAVVHGSAFARSARSPEAWLLAHGARLALTSPESRVYELPVGSSK